MEFRLSEKEQAFYEEVEEFLKKELPSDWAAYNRAWPGGYASGEIPGAGIREAFVHYRQKLMEKGWLTIAWPKEYGGREYTYMEKAIFDERTSYYRAPNVDVIAVGMVGPTILEIGTEEQKQEWLPRIASGEVSMWLGYSEPNAGSDLAGIQTTAVEEGDEYIINGQKVWSSGAHVSDYAWLIARTDPTATRHKGVSFFIVDSKSPGITVRPLINIFGTHHFNEVFFDNVRVPKKNLIGQKNMGFYYLMTALDFERVILVGIGGFKRIFEELVEHVKRTERQGKPLKNYQSVRLKLARIATEIEIGYMLFWRTAEMLDKVAMDVFGPYSLIEEETEFTPFRGMAPRGYIDCISATIGAGTSEIQRNIIALRGLGLPRG
ncbi:MAG: acyl-CoA dehydrogenase family protein [Deltaproteobacteria bacterium]|nr:acyl-CoA dehydrogenase family protein [Deltaproteobacteria bacterium]